MQVCRGRGADEIGVGGVGAGVAQVLGDGGMEQEGVLEHHAQLAVYEAMVISRRSVPSTRIRPACGPANRATRAVIVVFPAPLGPTRATNCPGAMSTVKSSMAGRSAPGR